MLEALLGVVLPVAVVAAVGAAVGRWLRPDPSAVTKISLYALSPALALDTLSRAQVPAADAVRLAAGYGLYLAALGGLAWLAGAGGAPAERRAGVLAAIIGNTGNFGLPISLFALGQAGLERSLILFVANVVATFTVGPLVLSPAAGWGRLRSVARLPLVWAALLGVILNASGVRLPLGLERGVALLASATVPMVLLALGLQIGGGGWPKLTPFVVRSSLVRLLAGPPVAWGAGRLVGAGGLELQVLVLAAAMPTAVNAFLLASELRGEADEVAGTVVVTTFASLATISAVVALLPWLGG